MSFLAVDNNALPFSKTGSQMTGPQIAGVLSQLSINKSAVQEIVEKYFQKGNKDNSSKILSYNEIMSSADGAIVLDMIAKAAYGPEVKVGKIASEADLKKAITIFQAKYFVSDISEKKALGVNGAKGTAKYIDGLCGEKTLSAICNMANQTLKMPTGIGARVSEDSLILSSTDQQDGMDKKIIESYQESDRTVTLSEINALLSKLFSNQNLIPNVTRAYGKEFKVDFEKLAESLSLVSSDDSSAGRGGRVRKINTEVKSRALSVKRKLSEYSQDNQKVWKALGVENDKDLAYVMSYLNMVAAAEGTGDKYNMAYGGSEFELTGEYPTFAITAGNYTSTAKGRYQELTSTHNDVVKWIKAKTEIEIEFDVQGQDIAAWFNASQKEGRGVTLAMLKDPNMFEEVLARSTKEWASIPTALDGSSHYGQSFIAGSELVETFNQAKLAQGLS